MRPGRLGLKGRRKTRKGSRVLPEKRDPSRLQEVSPTGELRCPSGLSLLKLVWKSKSSLGGTGAQRSGYSASPREGAFQQSVSLNRRSRCAPFVTRPASLDSLPLQTDFESFAGRGSESGNGTVCFPARPEGLDGFKGCPVTPAGLWFASPPIKPIRGKPGETVGLKRHRNKFH
ncbi:Hypothetical predicted protein [Podarcis lilfordi]|uniref:Uncharacterized protein n=1 Tax=Podarcis lilfordi TaxID=74358 RepID=A0AA35KTL2_9SAUR|nr:Hypothetical predicted protein [Podarcis lilfordi]